MNRRKSITVYECVECGGSSVVQVPTPLAHFADCSADNIESVEYVRADDLNPLDAAYIDALEAQVRELRHAAVSLPSGNDGKR